MQLVSKNFAGKPAYFCFHSYFTVVRGGHLQIVSRSLYQSVFCASCAPRGFPCRYRIVSQWTSRFMHKMTFYLNKTNLLNVYYSLIVSHLRYGITVWNHGNQTIVQKLQRICNKFITYIQKNKHIDSLNLLSINDIFTLETCAFMLKLNRNQLPEIFNPLFQFNEIVHPISTQNKNAYHYPFYSKSATQQSITVGLRCGMLSRMT